MYSLSIQVDKLHVHRMDRGEDIGAALYHTLSCFRHCHWGARGQENGFISATQRQIADKVSFD